MTKRPSKKAMEKAVAEWNTKHPSGTEVVCWPGVRAGQGLEGETTSEAMILGGHTAGVYVAGRGFMALSHVEAVRP